MIKALTEVYSGTVIKLNKTLKYNNNNNTFIKQTKKITLNKMY